MRVECTVEGVDLPTEDGERTVPGVCVACGRCDHSVDVFGTSVASYRRGFVMLREGCPLGESNFYVDWSTDCG